MTCADCWQLGYKYQLADASDLLRFLASIRSQTAPNIVNPSDSSKGGSEPTSSPFISAAKCEKGNPPGLPDGPVIPFTDRRRALQRVSSKVSWLNLAVSVAVVVLVING
jgi:hypothetical protein